MRKVFKYQIEHGEVGRISSVMIPTDAKFVLFDEQDRNFCVWFEVDPHGGLEERRFGVFATGESVPEHFHHVASSNRKIAFGTVEFAYFCWHLYEFKE